MTLSRTKAEYVALSAYSQEVKLVIMLLVEMNKFQKPSVIYEDKKGSILLAKNRQVLIRTKKIDIHHNFLRVIVEDNDIDVQFIRSEDNPAHIMTNNTPEADFVNAHEEDHRGRTFGAHGYWKGKCQEYQSHELCHYL